MEEGNMPWKAIKIYLFVYLLSMSSGIDMCISCDPEGSRDFLFIRHGQTDWGPQDILKGPLDLRLNEEGRRQAQHAFEITRDNTDITSPLMYSSSLVRAYETAEIFAKN